MSGGGTPQYAFDQQGSASNILANILGQQFRNYQAMFVPEENKLLDYATDPNTIPNAQKRAMALTQGAFQAGDAGFTKGIEGKGIVLNAQQKATLDRQRQQTQQLATVDSANRSGARTYDSITGILSGAPTSTGIVPGSNTLNSGTGIG